MAHKKVIFFQPSTVSFSLIIIVGLFKPQLTNIKLYNK